MTIRNNIMLPTPFTETLFNRLPKPCIVQPKLEGDRMRSETIDHKAKLWSSSSKPRNSVPHICGSLEALNIPWETDGELFRRGMRHSEIRSIVGRTKNLHKDHWKMQYWIYDIVISDAQYMRLDMLNDFKSSISSWPTNIVIVPSMEVSNLDQFQFAYEMYLEQGFEGIIIRHPYRPYKRSGVNWMLKLKPRLSGEYRIINVRPLVDKNGVTHDTMGAFTLVDSEDRTFSVGTGPTALQREYFWNYRKEFIGKTCKIRFQGFTKATGVPKMQSIDKQWLKENGG